MKLGFQLIGLSPDKKNDSNFEYFKITFFIVAVALVLVAGLCDDVSGNA